MSNNPIMEVLVISSQSTALVLLKLTQTKYSPFFLFDGADKIKMISENLVDREYPQQ
ncbi:MAG: hypothetical protein ACR2IS_15940 [Nitrososphaeraceae archaeon]